MKRLSSCAHLCRREAAFGRQELAHLLVVLQAHGLDARGHEQGELLRARIDAQALRQCRRALWTL